MMQVLTDSLPHLLESISSFKFLKEQLSKQLNPGDDINKLFLELGDNNFFTNLDVLNYEDIENRLEFLDKKYIKDKIIEIYKNISPTIYDFYEAFM